jgi:phosphoribosylformylglycinamidine (FGAM) synthase PurS component
MAQFRVTLCVQRIPGVWNPEAFTIEKILRDSGGAFGYTTIEEGTLTMSRLFEFILSVKNIREAQKIAEKMLKDNFLANSQIEVANIVSVKKVMRKKEKKNKK